MTLQHGNGLPHGGRRQGKEKAGNQQSRTERAERRNVHDAVHLTLFWTICKRARPPSVTVRSPMSATIRSSRKSVARGKRWYVELSYGGPADLKNTKPKQQK